MREARERRNRLAGRHEADPTDGFAGGPEAGALTSQKSHLYRAKVRGW
jgi:hypothetical protein